MSLSNELSCEAGGFSCCCNPHRYFQSEVLRLHFPALEPRVCMLCLDPQLFLPVYPHAHVGPPAPPATTSPTGILQLLPCHVSSLPQLPICTPTGLDECFFFNSLVVGLLYNSIFWHFWLLFDFKFVIVLVLVVQRGSVYLPTPPSWPEVPHFLFQGRCKLNVDSGHACFHYISFAVI